MAGPNNSNNDNEGFEFNENDSALVPPSGNSLSKRRRSMDATLEVAGIMARQPARDQALRKRRKSVLDRTSAANVIAQQEENVVGRDLRKRKGSSRRVVILYVDDDDDHRVAAEPGPTQRVRWRPVAQEDQV